MKKFFILLFALFMLSGALAQSCLPEGITFTTQTQIDNFQDNYPGCTEILGDVVINGDNGITNLGGLSSLTSIGGNLNMVENHSLSSLAGLEGLASIGYWFNIVFNDSLTSLTGLEGLTSIGGGLVINENNLLTNLTGLEGLTSTGSVLRIAGNLSLTSLTGLENINAGSITELQILENPSLSTCDIISICSYLFNPNGTIDIQNNASGCNSQDEVEAVCGFGLDESAVDGQRSTVNIYLFSIIGSYKILNKVNLGLELRNENRTRAERENDQVVSSSGYNLVYTIPHVSCTITKHWSISANAELPFYRHYNGIQLGNKFAVSARLSYQINFSRSLPEVVKKI